jgi:hypothetical protein
VGRAKNLRGSVNSSWSWTIMVIDSIINDYTVEQLSDKDLFAIHRVLVHRYGA